MKVSQNLKRIYIIRDKKTRNDPSAGSPTDALLRLLFPLDHTVRRSFYSLYTSEEAYMDGQSLQLTE